MARLGDFGSAFINSMLSRLLIWEVTWDEPKITRLDVKESYEPWATVG